MHTDVRHFSASLHSIILLKEAMKAKKLQTASIALLLGCVSLQAQYKWENPQNQPTAVVRGQAWQQELKNTYARLPERAKANVRKPVWDLSQQSAGLSIAFRSNAPEIKVRYVVTGGMSMPHMPSTGVSGVDMYATDANGMSRWCRGNYAFGDTVSYTYSGLTYFTSPDKGYEYELFLPLYNHVSWMEIGVPQEASFRFLPVSQEKPLVVYGTSIAQGACASRPGMAWGNIINRTLGHPVVNLGFSGNGKLEPELFDLLAEIDAQLYIIDCMPNLPGKDASTVIYDRTLAGIKDLRKKSKAPILLVEHSGYTNEYSNKDAEESYRVANKELRRAYEDLKVEGIQELYYLTKEEIGLSMDAMVEGVHPSDLGMQQYADSYIKKIKSILRQENKSITSCSPCKQQRDPYDWNGRHEEVLKLNKQSAPDILMIGNSITHFWGGEPIAENRFGVKSWEKLFKGKKVRNLGFGWDKTENVLWRIYHGELDGYQAKNIFLLIGTNNLQSNTDEEVIEGIANVVKAIWERQPNARLCVMGILPRAKMEARVAKVNKKLSETLTGCTYINLAPQLTNTDGTIIPTLFRDGLHPNETGYERIAGILKGYL